MWSCKGHASRKRKRETTSIPDGIEQGIQRHMLSYPEYGAFDYSQQGICSHNQGGEIAKYSFS